MSEKELAEVRTTYHGGNDPSMIAGWDAINRGPGESGIAIFTPLRYSIPSTASHYVNKSDGVEWNSEVRHAVFDPVYEAWETYGLLSRGWTRYEPGRVYSESWGRAAAGPLLPTRDDPWWGAVRQGDSIIVDLPLYGDGDGHPGDGVASGGTELYRDGTKIGETAWPGVGQFTAPAGEGVYQLKVHSERDTPFRLSTRTDVTWSFRSGHVDGDRPVALPLWSVRFSPPVDGHNVATAGRPVAVPVTVVPHPGASAGRLRTATVHASYDDGVTWTPVEMSGGDDWTALLKHPAGEGFVSLRATATDSQGNSVDQTIIRAYQYGPAA